MNQTAIFKKSQIAPCGMNCGTCIAYLREKKRCSGCRSEEKTLPASCANCIIRNCEIIHTNFSGFCYDCEKFPCRRLKDLDKRYRTKYNTSFIENLLMIKEKGIDNFLVFESVRRSCGSCGAVLSVHKTSCLKCGYVV